MGFPSLALRANDTEDNLAINNQQWGAVAMSMNVARRWLWDVPTNLARQWKHEGTAQLLAKLRKEYRRRRIPRPKPLSRRRARQWEREFSRRPRISLVVPVSKTRLAWLRSCVNSVRSQYYNAWELILVDDRSEMPRLASRLERYSRRDDRIRVISLSENAGIAGATNVGIEAAAGEFIGFLGHEDELSPDALTWIVAALNRLPHAVWLYSDEDKITKRGKRFGPYFKPAYSPEFLLANPYTAHFSVYTADLLRSVQGLRAGFDGSEDHDLALRLSEIVRRDQVVHIPRILYHRRAAESSTAAPINGRKAVSEALTRRGQIGEVRSHPILKTAYQIRFRPKFSPTVRILIPTHNGLYDLRACLDSIEHRTCYKNYRITVIDNRSDDPDLLRFLDRAESLRVLEVVRDPRPFNHSRMHNDVIAKCPDDFLVFMNNDVELLTDGWLEHMLGTAELDDSIAGVGSLLFYPDRTVQHAGIYLGREGIAGHVHRGLDADNPGYFGQAHLLKGVSAATAALLLMKRTAFAEVGGFDAERYPTSFNDVDLWLRLAQQGYRCVYNPEVRAIHHESKSRRVVQAEEDVYQERFRRQWAGVVDRDPFYNPNLSTEEELAPDWHPYPIRSWQEEIFRCQTVTGNKTPSQPFSASRAA